jgi:hypothetical protein
MTELFCRFGSFPINWLPHTELPIADMSPPVIRDGMELHRSVGMAQGKRDGKIGEERTDVRLGGKRDEGEHPVGEHQKRGEQERPQRGVVLHGGIARHRLHLFP